MPVCFWDDSKHIEIQNAYEAAFIQTCSYYPIIIYVMCRAVQLDSVAVTQSLVGPNHTSMLTQILTSP